MMSFNPIITDSTLDWFRLTRIIYNNRLFLPMTGWISALISSIFGAGEEVEKILEEE